MWEWQFTPQYITWYPDEDFSSGCDGKDVVLHNLRQLCVFREAKKYRKLWLCGIPLRSSILGLDLRKIERLMDNPNRGVDNPVLKELQEAQGKCIKVLFLKAICVVLKKLPSQQFFWMMDTFEGRVFECPIVHGVHFKGDSYSSFVGQLPNSLGHFK
ncbi:Vacuolar-sorting receptor 3 [Striga hermonthica]|uniref:Vacuolar-sorting receptor 3 n=1 Tax=Striga hermonthica TaxID=68872 RepID=A0A9N7N5U3_STRHE|nr:Vacuolar-sorting receptor 3 [Striga hermonthica]